MTQSGYLLLGLTAIVGGLIAILVFALLRFGAAARDVGRRTGAGGAEHAFLTAALQEAVTKLKGKERASAARADASERLSAEIIASMASGLLVVGLEGEVKILNPAGRRMLGLPEALDVTFREVLLPRAPALVGAIEECLQTREPIVRRAVDVQPTWASPYRRSSTARHRSKGRSAYSATSRLSSSSKSSSGSRTVWRGSES